MIGLGTLTYSCGIKRLTEYRAVSLGVLLYESLTLENEGSPSQEARNTGRGYSRPRDKGHTTDKIKRSLKGLGFYPTLLLESSAKAKHLHYFAHAVYLKYSARVCRKFHQQWWFFLCIKNGIIIAVI